MITVVLTTSSALHRRRHWVHTGSTGWNNKSRSSKLSAWATVWVETASVTNLKEFLTGLILLKIYNVNWIHRLAKFSCVKVRALTGKRTLHRGLGAPGWTSTKLSLDLLSCLEFYWPVQRASSPGRLTFWNRCLQRMLNLHHHSFAVTRPLTWIKSQHALRQRLANFLKDQRINILSFADHISSVTTT